MSRDYTAEALEETFPGEVEFVVLRRVDWNQIRDLAVEYVPARKLPQTMILPLRVEG